MSSSALVKDKLMTLIKKSLARLRRRLNQIDALEAHSTSIQQVLTSNRKVLDDLLAGQNSSLVDALNRLNHIGVVVDGIPQLQGTALNELNRIYNSVLILSQRISDLESAVQTSDRLSLLDRRASSQRLTYLEHTLNGRTAEEKVLAPASYDFNEQLARLKAAAPVNFEQWLKLFNTGAAAYEKRQPSDLSTTNHREAFYFRQFLAVHAAGRILDIGTGPLPVPSYLLDISPDRIAGVDPLDPYGEHPFKFAQSFAEYLPWPDASFETVIAATSIDHVYLLDVALSEVARVLSPRGRFLIWTGIFLETPPYNPYEGLIVPPDKYHLFHPGENWFPALLQQSFRLLERFDVGPNNSFFALEKKS